MGKQRGQQEQKKSGKAGRPPADNPKDVQLRVRVDRAMGEALERYRAANHLGDKSDAVRHILGRALADAGLLE